ncbi:hypothetical protein [uncultured Caulobacter sp.]|uniref:hypothetical protein n=1 Tax=uncultured Caulobacter sp. TaxID=158749 RepID=UPI00262AC4A8|nr:hypothetical protein [uncultured Caulobacter sp.]
MTASILIVGQDPDTVDFNAPGIAPGMTADKVRAGVEAALADLTAKGLAAKNLYIQPDPAVAEREVAEALAAAPYDVVVVGAGVRVPPIRLFLFEAVINAIHRGAPNARIAFNTRPDDSAEAALRWAGR